jgi:hypothetical protein
MVGLFLVFFLLSLAGLMVGLIRPDLLMKWKGVDWGEEEMRKKVLLTWGVVSFLFFVLVIVFAAPPSSEVDTKRPRRTEERLELTPKEEEKPAEELIPEATFETTAPSEEESELNIETATKVDWGNLSYEEKVKLAQAYLDANKPESLPPNTAQWLVKKTEEVFASDEFDIYEDVKFAMDSAIAGYRAEQKASGIPQIRLGMRKEQVKRLMGPPDNIQTMESQYLNQELWYYEFQDHLYQYVFERGRLRAKNKY